MDAAAENTIKESDQQRYRKASALLREAEKPVRILRHLAWPESVRESFLKSGASRLPEVEYPAIDLEPVTEPLGKARKLLHEGHPVDDWLLRTASAIGHGADLLNAAGTAEFLDHSIALYGSPLTPLRDQSTTALDLARHLDDFLDSLDHVDLGTPADACWLASDVARRMEEAVQKYFGDEAPEVEVVDQLSANALAGPSRIRIRRQACFTDRDASQLIHHEALVHVATSLNGRSQEDLPILAASHPGTTRTQEGLAVFAEFITGSMELDRLRRLADRVIAIEMAIEGADFIEVYRYFLERTNNPGQSFENTRRVFRGGVLTGGTPFTKDIVYLDGLLRVHNFLRVAVSEGRADCLRLLYCGKLDLEDIPALAHLTQAGLCREPRFLPPWLKDLRFLLSYLAYSGFLNSVDLDTVQEHYRKLFRQAPLLNGQESGH